MKAELAPRARALWAAFESRTGTSSSARFYESFHFGDSESLADELATLVLAGTKRATASLVWSYEAEGKVIPEPGELSIVENWAGEPVCIIETTSVDVVPFRKSGARVRCHRGRGGRFARVLARSALGVLWPRVHANWQAAKR